VPLPVRLKSIPLWSPRWSAEALRARYNQDERSFERGFRLRAYSDEEMSFPGFEGCRMLGVSLGDIQRSNWPAYTGVDLSSKKRPGNAIVTIKIDPRTRRRYPVDVRFGAWKSNEVCEQLADVNSAYRPIVIMVEDNGYQAALIEWAQAWKGANDFWMKLEPITTTSETKTNAELGLPALQVEFKNKAWVVPYSEYEHATREDKGPPGQWARWDYEFRNHPLATTSDGVMATWFARQGVELYGGATGEASDGGSLGDIHAR
jgi:hypothetical protein